MKLYEVVWSKEALHALADIWLVARDRSAIALASELADRQLMTNPHQFAHPVAEGLMAMTIPPMRFYYSVDETS